MQGLLKITASWGTDELGRSLGPLTANSRLIQSKRIKEPMNWQGNSALLNLTKMKEWAWVVLGNDSIDAQTAYVLVQNANSPGKLAT